MITQKKANEFAQQWIKAWNSHDIDKIIAHYAKDVILVSPIAGKLLGDPEVRGLEAVKRYFLKGLEAYPNLNFKLQEVFPGEQSIVLLYLNQKGERASEFMLLDLDNKVVRMYAHYCE